MRERRERRRGAVGEIQEADWQLGWPDGSFSDGIQSVQAAHNAKRYDESHAQHSKGVCRDL